MAASNRTLAVCRLERVRLEASACATVAGREARQRHGCARAVERRGEMWEKEQVL